MTRLTQTMFLYKLTLLTILFGSSQTAWNVTCDFDLEPIEKIIEYLPKECQEIYKLGSISELYKASLEESKEFNKFYEKLDQLERKTNQTPKDQIPPKNTTLRFEIYEKAMLSECTNITDDSQPEKTKTMNFYICLLTKRTDMIESIPS